jgi:hypothetical protein
MLRKTGSGMLPGGLVIGLLAFTAFAAYQLRTRGLAPANALTLDPNLFEGETWLAYEAAREHPELLARLHCYCGCEQHQGHKSLLDCFRTDHAAECATCIGEAITAAQMYEGGGSPVAQIADALRRQYGNGS